MVVFVVWPLYCLHWEGSSMERMKMDLPDWEEVCQRAAPGEGLLEREDAG